MFPPKQASTVHPEDLLHLREVVERKLHRDRAVPVEGREGRIRTEPIADRLLRGEGAEDAAVRGPDRRVKLHLDRASRPLRVRVVDRQARPEARSAFVLVDLLVLVKRRGRSLSAASLANQARRHICVKPYGVSFTFMKKVGCVLSFGPAVNLTLPFSGAPKVMSTLSTEMS